MRFWISGPRMFSGLVRPGVSFGPEDLRARRVQAIHLEIARKAERQRPVRPSIAGFIVRAIVAVPIAAFTIGAFWIAAMLFSALIRG
jgi:hypothetical protein